MYHVAEVEINNPHPSGKTLLQTPRKLRITLVRFFPLIIQSLLVKKEFGLVLIWDGIMYDEKIKFCCKKTAFFLQINGCITLKTYNPSTAR